MEKKISFDSFDSVINYLIELKKIFPVPMPSKLAYPKNTPKRKCMGLNKINHALSKKNTDCRHYLKCLDYAAAHEPEWWGWSCQKCWWRKNKDRKIDINLLIAKNIDWNKII